MLPLVQNCHIIMRPHHELFAILYLIMLGYARARQQETAADADLSLAVLLTEAAPPRVGTEH